VKIEAVSAPGLEMRVAFDALFAYRRRRRRACRRSACRRSACRRRACRRRACRGRRRSAGGARFEDASCFAAAGTIVGIFIDVIAARHDA
jgi:hypothetical protein